jgi:hypothetical protein
VAAPQLSFSVVDAAPLQHAAAPTLRFTLQTAGTVPVRSLLLDVQIGIAARRRAYAGREVDRLFELFGHEKDWGANLRTLLWTRTTLVVPPFTREATVHLDVPCSYDLQVVASRYFDALAGGEVPLEFLFSGSVFYAGETGLLQTERIGWDQEASYRLPVAVWEQTMRRHFHDTAWLRLNKDAFDRLATYKARNAFATWEDALAALLAVAEEHAWTP